MEFHHVWILSTQLRHVETISCHQCANTADIPIQKIENIVLEFKIIEFTLNLAKIKGFVKEEHVFATPSVESLKWSLISVFIQYCVR